MGEFSIQLFKGVVILVKKTISLFLCFLIVYVLFYPFVNPVPVKAADFAKGADVSWLLQMEDKDISFMTITVLPKIVFKY